MKPYIDKLRYAISAFIIVTLFSCHNYYKIASLPVINETDKAAKLDSLKQANKDFILRSNSNAFVMKNPVINKDQKILECTLDKPAFFNQTYINDGLDGDKRYYKNVNDAHSVFNEVHLFIPKDTLLAEGKYLLPLYKVKRIDVIEKDKARTTGSHILGGIGITAGVLAVVGIFALIFASSSSLGFHF